MVKKQTRFGINSGNSFKLGSLHSTIKRNSHRQNVLVKSFNNQHFGSDAEEKNNLLKKEAKEFLDDGGIEETTWATNQWGRFSYEVEYSLNKRKRWLLPGQLRRVIDEVKELREDGNDGAVPLRFIMVEREIPPVGRDSYRSINYGTVDNDCTHYHDSHIQESHVVPRHKYSHITDLRACGKHEEKDKYQQTAVRLRVCRRLQCTRAKNRGVQRKSEAQQHQRMDESNGQDQNDRIDPWIFRAHRNGASLVEEGPPEMRYEICRPQHILGHNGLYDNSHIQKFIWNDWRSGKSSKAWKKGKHRYKDNHRTASLDMQLAVDEEAHGCVERDVDDALLEEDEEALWLGIKASLLPDQHGEQTADSARSAGSNVLQDAFEKALDSSSRLCLDSDGKPKKHRIRANSKQRRAHQDKNYAGTNTASSLRVHIHPKGSSIFLEDFQNTSTLGKESGSADSAVEPGSTSGDALDWVIDPANVESYIDEISGVVCTEVAPAFTSVASLQATFGQCYKQAKCLPHQFAIEVETGCDADDARKSEAYVVFEEINADKVSVSIKADLSPEKEQAILGNLQSELLQTKQCSEDIDCNPSPTVTDIVRLAQSWLSADRNNSMEIDNSNAGRHRRVADRGPSGNMFSLLHAAAGTSVQSCTTHTAYEELDSQRLQDSTGLFEWVTKDMAQPDSNVPEYCHICYDHLQVDAAEGVPGNNGTALLSCRHWFCKQCWRRHIKEQVRQGTLNITCPGYECEAVLDQVTLLCLCSYPLYTKHRAHLQETLLETNANWKWCPNSRCGRVVKATSFKRKISKECPLAVQCECGERWCFLCQKEAHSPATCQQAELYSKIRKQRGDDGVLFRDIVIFVNVKHCGLCRYPIEKNGGCQHMLCSRCGFSFCWECLGEWSAHGDWLQCSRGTVKESVVEVDQSMDVRLHEYYYGMATRFRMQRKAWRLTTSQRKMASLARKISRACNKKATTSAEVSLYDPLAGCQDTWKKLMEVENFKYQAWFVLEYGYVILCCHGVRSVVRLLMEHIDRLALIMNRVEQILCSNSKREAIQMLEPLNRLLEAGKAAVSHVLRKASEIQHQIGQKQLKNHSKPTATSIT